MRRVVVTGLGLLTPLGCGVEASWDRLIKGQSGIGQLEGFDVSDLNARIGGQIPEGDTADGLFAPDDWMPPNERRQIGRASCRERV